MPTTRGHLYEQDPTDRRVVSDLEHYASQAVSLSHPALLPVLDVLREDGTARWALLVPSIGDWLGLSELIRRIDSTATACSVALSVAEALGYLHQVRFRGAQSFDWEDFVRARVEENGALCLSLLPPNPTQIAREQEGCLWGNLWYLAPELLTPDRGTPTPMSDSFSLGAVLFELVTAEPLVQATDAQGAVRETLAGRFRRPSAIRPDLDPRLDDFIVRATGQDPQARPTLTEWSRVMQRFGGSPLPPVPPLQASEAQVTTRREGPNSSGSAWSSALPGRAGMLRITKEAGLGKGAWSSARLVTCSHDALWLEDRDPDGEDRQAPAQPGAEASALPAEIANRPRAVTDSTDPVDCSVFARPEAYRGEQALLHVFLHRPEQVERAKELALEFDDHSRRVGWQSLEVDVPQETRLQVQLTVPGLPVDEPVQFLTWRGRPTVAQFGIEVPERHPAESVIGKVTVYRDALPIGHIKFRLAIKTARPAATLPAARPLGVEAHRYRSAFISYASRDRSEVLKRVQMLERFKVPYFQDLLSLEPGARWEEQLYRHIDECDLFLLFWSSNARESDWVAKEIEYALNRKGADELGPPEIVPVIIEGPPAPPPPERLRHIHFDDRLIHMAAG